MTGTRFATLLVTICFLAVARAAPEGAAVQQAADEAAMIADISAIMADRKIPGAQVAVVTPERAIWQRAFGVRDLTSSSPMTTDTLIQVGSVTKVFTASLAADLVADAKLDWSDSIAERLGGISIRPELARITLEQLVTHTSRLPANPPNRIDVDGVMQPYGVTELHASLVDPSVKLLEPGRTYSNWGYALLGHIVERTAGKAFEDVLEERIFVPLDMTRSKIALEAADERDLAVHYWPEDQPRIARPRWVFGAVAGFGGITSTAGDLAKFVRYQIKPEARADVLDAPAMRSLRVVRTLGSTWQAGGGRGWLIVRDADGSLTIEHSGEVDGHSSYMGFSPDMGVGVAVTANLGGPSAREIALPVLSRAVDQARQSRPIDRKEAMAWFARRQWADAEVALARVVTAVPADGEAWHHLGLARYELRDLPGAEAALLRATKHRDNPDSSFFMLAVIAASQGRIDSAFQLLDRIAGREPMDLDRVELRLLRSDARWAKVRERFKARAVS